MLVLQLQSRVGKTIAEPALVLPQVSWGFCHLLDWKSPKPIPFLSVLNTVETELGTGRKQRSWGSGIPAGPWGLGAIPCDGQGCFLISSHVNLGWSAPSVPLPSPCWSASLLQVWGRRTGSHCACNMLICDNHGVKKWVQGLNRIHEKFCLTCFRVPPAKPNPAASLLLIRIETRYTNFIWEHPGYVTWMWGSVVCSHNRICFAF